MSDVDVIRTKNGQVLGRRFGPYGQTEVLGCLGIPYAQPPVGELRYQKPLPVKNWDDVRDCRTFGPHSPFFSPFRDGLSQAQEDCFYLNVFTPLHHGKVKEALPVLFYIHGGGFIWDSSNVVGDENLARHVCTNDVVVVTFNYRLGFLGFLAWDEQVKGNFGLWDMAAALRWTHDNVEQFGGDPTRITVAGQSAGGASADLLSLSPHTRHLFSQVICMAGTADCAFAVKPRPLVKALAKEFAVEVLGLKRNATDEQVLERFREEDAMRLVAGRPFGTRKSGLIQLGPVLDGDFFPATVEQLREQAPPQKFLTGVTEFECLQFAALSLAFPSFRDSVQLHADAFTCADPRKVLQLYDQVVDQSPGKTKEEEFRDGVKFLDHLLFGYGTRKTVKDRVRKGDVVHQYRFRFFKQGSLGATEAVLPFKGACHCLELPYFLGVNLLGEFEPDETDQTVLDSFGQRLLNFVKTGRPDLNNSEEWGPVELDHLDRHFSFDLEGQSSEEPIYEAWLQLCAALNADET